ncbi:hypothetical protein WAE61_18770 [Comamonadaceae bacterium PP-2]
MQRALTPAGRLASSQAWAWPVAASMARRAAPWVAAVLLLLLSALSGAQVAAAVWPGAGMYPSQTADARAATALAAAAAHHGNAARHRAPVAGMAHGERLHAPVAMDPTRHRDHSGQDPAADLRCAVVCALACLPALPCGTVDVVGTSPRLLAPPPLPGFASVRHRPPLRPPQS